MALPQERKTEGGPIEIKKPVWRRLDGNLKTAEGE